MCQSCGPDRTDHVADSTPFLTRRRVLAAGAVAGATVAFRGLPALGQTGTASSDGSSSTEPGTTTTTTAPRGLGVAEPVHGEDEPPPAATASFDTLLSESPNQGIMFPVFPNSATSWTRSQDTYGACRSGCSRRHQGEDLMAPKMTKLLAVKAGVVVELRHRSGGNSLYIRGDDGWFYCYLHINNDRPGTDDASNLVANAWGPGLRKFATSGSTMNEAGARGYRVRQGEVVAYCGDSGNAESTGAHLHFEIRKPASGTYSSETSRMWASASVNPRESLRGATPAREVADVPPETFRPWTTAEAFIAYQYQDFLGRAPSAADTAYYRDRLNSGANTPDWMTQLFLESAECDSKTHAVARLYQAFYKRVPDTAGFLYWLDQRRNNGWSINRMAEQFAKAPEFARMYGSVDNAGYVDLVYRNVLNRAPEAAGKQYWVGELQAGRITRGKMMTQVSESPENKRVRENEMHVLACYGVMLDRMPTASELSTWKGILDDGNSTRDMIVMLRVSDEYAAAIANS